MRITHRFLCPSSLKRLLPSRSLTELLFFLQLDHQGTAYSRALATACAAHSRPLTRLLQCPDMSIVSTRTLKQLSSSPLETNSSPLASPSGATDKESSSPPAPARETPLTPPTPATPMTRGKILTDHDSGTKQPSWDNSVQLLESLTHKELTAEVR